jgi:acetate kinase
MNGLGALVFTGGVGENSASVRREAAAGVRFLGVAIDSRQNADMRGDGEISAKGAKVRSLVVRAREDVEVSREVRRFLS